MRVDGNSTRAKYAAADAGDRGTAVELQVKGTETVRSVRDRAGVLLLGLRPGWTLRTQRGDCEVLDHTGQLLFSSSSPSPSRPAFPIPAIQTADDLIAGAADAAVAADLGRQLNATEAVEEATIMMTAMELPPETPTIHTNHTDESATALLTEQEQEQEQLEKELSSGSFKGRRFRRTSWLKEFTDLLEEVNPDAHLSAPSSSSSSSSSSSAATATASATGAIKKKPPILKEEQRIPDIAGAGIDADAGLLTVKEAQLRGGDTLLLEEGYLPVKGQVSLQVLCTHFSYFSLITCTLTPHFCQLRNYIDNYLYTFCAVLPKVYVWRDHAVGQQQKEQQVTTASPVLVSTSSLENSTSDHRGTDPAVTAVVLTGHGLAAGSVASNSETASPPSSSSSSSSSAAVELKGCQDADVAAALTAVEKSNQLRRSCLVPLGTVRLNEQRSGGMLLLQRCVQRLLSHPNTRACLIEELGRSSIFAQYSDSCSREG